MSEAAGGEGTASASGSSTGEARDRAIAALVARDRFRKHLATYVFVNVLLWAIWAFVPSARGDGGVPWPLWATLGWGFGVVSQYLALNQRSMSEAAIAAEMRRQAGG